MKSQCCFGYFNFFNFFFLLYFSICFFFLYKFDLLHLSIYYIFLLASIPKNHINRKARDLRLYSVHDKWRVLEDETSLVLITVIIS